MNLIIIGNGFDRHCGLKSGFSDYYNYKLENDEFCKVIMKYYDFEHEDHFNFSTFLSNKIKDEDLKNYSIWDILFLHERKQGKTNWADLEDAMYKSLVANDENQFNWKLVIKYLEDKRLWPITYNHVTNMKYGEIITEIITKELKIVTLLVIYIKRKYNEIYRSNGMTKKDLYYVLEKELKIFEEFFRNYMDKIVNDEYYKKQEDLLFKLSNKKRATLSFNYTTVQDDNYPVENVHGRLQDKDIIIGIDAKELNYEEDIFRFTKTYRKMKTLNKKEINPILSKDITRLIFYGHSLNPQDYSYFQSIFDYLDLYSNDNIELIFYYSIYDKTREKEIEKEHYESIVKLISIYGDSLDNKDKGKNLLHKLLLKNSIQIKEIEL